MNGVVSANGLRKSYATACAVDGVDFTVRDGEVFGLLGPNGAGKSTTIEMLLGFTPPTSGTARVFGRDMHQTEADVWGRIGVVPDDCSVYEQLTGTEHVSLAVRAGDADSEPAELLSVVGIDPADRDRPAGEYSKGMRQRLLLALALVGDPELLILDEPSSGLDPTGIAEIRELILDRANAGTTVVFSSHNLPEVEAVCDRVAILNDGEVAAIDTIEGLREQTGGVARITATAETVITPETASDLREQPDVVSVDVTETEVTAVVGRPEAKARVIGTLTDRATITDLSIRERSLEELFTLYTERKGESQPDGERVGPNTHSGVRSGDTA